MNYLLVVILWTAYCALHSFLISIRFTALMTRLLKNFLSSLTSESVSSYCCERTIIDHSRIRFWRPMPRRLHRRM